MDLLFYTFAAFGMAYICGHAKITFSIRALSFEHGGPVARFFVELLECPACLGFWFGLGAGFLWSCPFWARGLPLWPLVLGLFTSGTNFILGRLTRLIGAPQ